MSKIKDYVEQSNNKNQWDEYDSKLDSDMIYEGCPNYGQNTSVQNVENNSSKGAAPDSVNDNDRRH
ncbi:hypothetical protein Enr17x_36220 [Gimesia fumaroli]|uniref:Uncharacterized protein n=1 Tax=Gimesia fumaroli TaxID=2527976 RepID=A0A518IEQ3_9PLAN|nr:hypothetical protein Enr17x_36220 [Gimesia fumaroli]